MAKDYDLIILGAGNAGFAPTSAARAAGLSVLVVEGRDFGGTCPLRGCVPKKVLVAAGETLQHIASASDHEIRVGAPEVDWPALIARKETFVEGVPQMFEDMLSNREVDTAIGRAKFTGDHTIEVNGESFNGKKILIATGSKPRDLPIPGFEHVISSDDILEMKERPESLVFIGAGVIGLEFGHVFQRAGTQVTILELAPRPLPGLDADAVTALTEESRRIGIDIVTEAGVEGIEKDGDKFTVKYKLDGKDLSVTADVIANGAGRVADVEDLDLDAAGIDHDRHVIKIDEHLRSASNPDVFVAGDANAAAGPQLSPVASYEGRIVTHNLLNDDMQTADYHNIPSCVFTVPPLASVGYQEKAAEEAGLKFQVKSNDLTSWRSAKTYAEKAAYAKVLVEDDTGRILGAHLLGHGAPETIHVFAFAISHGITADDISNTVYAYPTFMSDIKFLI